MKHFVTFLINLDQQFGSDNIQSYNSSYKITDLEGSEQVASGFPLHVSCISLEEKQNIVLFRHLYLGLCSSMSNVYI